MTFAVNICIYHGQLPIVNRTEADIRYYLIPSLSESPATTRKVQFDDRQQSGTMFKNSHPAPQSVVHLPQFDSDQFPPMMREAGLLEQQALRLV
jgi:hypothetical protein